MNENEMRLAASVLRWRVVSVISMMVATFALLVSIGSHHYAEECRNGVREALNAMEEEKHRSETIDSMNMQRMELFLKGLKDILEPRPRQAKKV